MTFRLPLFIVVNQLTILSCLAIIGGLYFLFIGFQLLGRKRRLLTTPTPKIRYAAHGLIEVNGMAAGPRTLLAPITGKECFLYHTTVWQLREGKKQEWEKVADETLHLPFFVDDSTGQLLVEPLGADIDVHHDVRQEYGGASSSDSNEIPPHVMVFLSRHRIVPVRRVRIEEHLIKPQDALFIAGTLTDNPGIQVRPHAPRNHDLNGNDLNNDGESNDHPRNPASNKLSQNSLAPQIIRLQSGALPSTAQEMSQQAKIAAALTRAGISGPEAWLAARVPYKSVALEKNVENAKNVPPAPLSDHDRDNSQEEKPKVFDSNLIPPIVLMKGTDDSTFVISFRSQKEFVSRLAWKSAAMIWRGAAVTLLGIYSLLAGMKLL